MRILLLTRYQRLGSSSRVRFYQYLPHLLSQGVEIATAPFFNDKYVSNLYQGQRTSVTTILGAYLERFTVLMRAASFDLLWVEKELFPWIPAWFEIILSALKIPYVVVYVDAVFHRYDMHSSGIVRALLGRKIDRVMRHAALVIAGNEYLAERARQTGARRVECLPSVVDVNQYTLSESTNSPVFRIGWIGSPVTAPYLDLVREAIGKLSEESPVTLTLIGSGNVPPFPQTPTETLSWTEAVELEMSQKFDVGMMPLVDGPFERGKCGYKLIQYMASGLPVIASPVGVNEQIVEPGVNGYLAESSADWLSAFRELRDDKEKRILMGQAGRRKAEQLYNLQGSAPRLLNLLSSLPKT